jgi:hypothetical protein
VKIAVIDTNVLIVANEASRGRNRRTLQASDSCIRAAVESLDALHRDEQRFALDCLQLVLLEYSRHLSWSGEPGLGDAFFKWMHDNQGNERVCVVAQIHRRGAEADDFEEFPDDAELQTFDRSDRKFVAICRGLQPQLTEVYNCVDSDWFQFRDALGRHGVEIRFLCPASDHSHPDTAQTRSQ